MTNTEQTPSDSRPADACQVQHTVRPGAEARRLAEAIDPMRRKTAPDHLTVGCAAQLLEAQCSQLERWEAYRAELVDMEQRLGKIAGNFLGLGAWEDAAECAMKAEGMRWVRGRMPPEA